MRRAAPVLALLLLAPGPARGWGRAGHELVGAIAEERLSPAGRALVRELAGEVRLSDPDLATWADAHRSPATRHWHYVNIPFAAGRFRADRDCPRGCAVSAVEEAVRVLAGREPPARRADALRWLVHLVADLHQPLHAGDGLDRGGNLVRVRLGRRREPTNLHHVWDHEVVAALLRGRAPALVARELAARLPPGAAERWAGQLAPAGWADASSQRSRELYAELGLRPGDDPLLALPAGYLAGQEARAVLALQEAGVRLAALLDDVAARRGP